MKIRYTRCGLAWARWVVLCGLIVWIFAGCTRNKKKPGISEVSSEAEISKPPVPKTLDLVQTEKIEFSWHQLAAFEGKTLRELKTRRPDIWDRLKIRLGFNFSDFIGTAWLMDAKWKKSGSTYDLRYICGATFRNSNNPNDGYETSIIFIDPLEELVSGTYISSLLEKKRVASIEGGVCCLPEIKENLEAQFLTPINDPVSDWNIIDYYQSTYISYFYSIEAVEKDSGTFKANIDKLGTKTFKGALNRDREFLKFETFIGTGEGRIEAIFQILPKNTERYFLFGTNYSNGIWSCTNLEVSDQTDFFRSSTIPFAQIGLDSLFESLFPANIWHWETALRDKLLPLEYSLMNDGEIKLVVRANTNNFEIAQRNYSRNPRWKLYAPIFTQDLSAKDQNEILKVHNKILEYKWKVDPGVFERIQ